MYSESKSIYYLDMSLLYLFHKNYGLLKSNLVYYTYLLKKVGVDYTEIDINMAEYILLKDIENSDTFPKFVLRVDGLNELNQFMNTDKNTLNNYDYVTMPLKVYMSYIGRISQHIAKSVDNSSIGASKANYIIEINVDQLLEGTGINPIEKQYLEYPLDVYSPFEQEDYDHVTKVKGTQDGTQEHNNKDRNNDKNNNRHISLIKALRKLMEMLQINNIQNDSIFAIKLVGDFDCCFKKYKLIQKFFNKFNINTIICPENNYHTATASAVDALTSGVNYLCGTFTGLHHHAPKLPLEEAIMASEVLLNYGQKGQHEYFQELKRLFENISSIALQLNKPILGSNIFNCESGIHVDGIIKASETYEPYQPEKVGLKRKIVLGKHSGEKALLYILNKNKTVYKIEDIPQILKRIKRLSACEVGTHSHRVDELVKESTQKAL